jgi:DNA-binding transcriptional LysR family regulator
MLDLRRLQVFREVASRGSFSEAAVALSYTQSAVSQQIAVLEREFGVPLLDRTTRRVELTDAGRALLGHAEDILRRVSEAEAEIYALAGLQAGRLRLACFPTAGATLMPAAIATFRLRHPAVELDLIEAEPDDALWMLRRGDADLAVVVKTETLPADCADGVERMHLLDDPMYVVLPRGHQLERKASVKLEDLSEEGWITVKTPRDSMVVVEACRSAGFEPRVVFRSDDYYAIQGFVAARMGVALIPGLGLSWIRDDIRVYSLGPDGPKRTVVAAVPAGQRTPAAGSMVDILMTTCPEHTGRC